MKAFGFRCIVLVTIFVYLEYALSVALLKPKVSFITSNEFNQGFNRDTPNASLVDDRQDTWYVPSGGNGNYVLVCNATYPITWIFHNAHFSGHAPWALSLRTRRTAGNIYDHTTFTYTAVLNMYGNYNRLTGNYTCSHVARQDLQSSVYIFWQGNSKQNFIRSNESAEVYAEDDVAILPCISSNPNFQNPVLKKIEGNVSRTFDYTGNRIRFEKKRGIILDGVSNIAGNYTCTVPGDSEFVSVEVKMRNESLPSDWLPTHKSNATISYDAATSRLKCCSSTRRSPVMMHYYCNHPAMCEFRKDFITPDIYGFHKKSRNGCSTVKLYVHSAGLIHCIGDGVDEYKQYVFGMYNWAIPRNTPQNISVYFHWAEIDPFAMIILQMYHGHWGIVGNATTYHGQVISFACQTSEYYFAEGTRWAIRWKNNTIRIHDAAINKFMGNYRHRSSEMVYQAKAHVDMEAIVCIAPVWNSTEYIHKPYPITVHASSQPVVNQTLEETFVWTMNVTKKEISCGGFGIPIPTISWQKLDDWQWHPAHANVNHTQSTNSSSNYTHEVVAFDRVSYTTNGTYICTISNFGGTIVRKIHILVEEPTSWKKTVGIIVGVVLSLVLLAGVALMVWRLWVEKAVIRQLSSAVTFKDGNIRPEPPEPASYDYSEPPSIHADEINSSIDPTRLSASLI